MPKYYPNTTTTNYPFGMLMPGRTYSSEAYSWGFNGQEKDDEISGIGLNYVFKYRINDTRTGRFFSVDPLFKVYPFNSTYAFAENTVIWAIELEGLEAYKTNDGESIGQVQGSDDVREIKLDDSEKALSREQQIDNLKCMIEKANNANTKESEYAKINLEYVSTPKKDDNLLLDVIAKVGDIAGLSVVVREGMEAEYLKQAKLNRALSGDFSKQVNHSVRSLRKLGKRIGVFSFIVSGLEFVEKPSAGKFLKVVVSGIMVGARINPVTGVIIGVADVTGASDALIYDNIDKLTQ